MIAVIQLVSKIDSRLIEELVVVVEIEDCMNSPKCRVNTDLRLPSNGYA